MKKLTILFIIISLSALSLVGCWDNVDIEDLHIVTGIALDVSLEKEGEMDISLQIANTQSGGASSSESSNASESKPLVLKDTSRTITAAIKKINRETSRTIFFHHLQVIVISLELAKKDVNEYIDYFLRDNQARLETPIYLVDGRAEDVLTAELPQEKMTSLFLANSFEDAKKVSKELQIRLIDVAFKLVEKTHCPILPVIKVEKLETGEEEDEIKSEEFAIIKNNKLLTTFSSEDIYGYLFAKGGVTAIDHEIEDGENVVVLHISTLEKKKSINLKDYNKVEVKLDVNIDSGMSEVIGFADLTILEQIEKFEELMNKDIKERILKTFAIAQNNKSDIFGYGLMIHKKHPKQWKELEDNWDEIFPTIDLQVEVKTKVLTTGQVSQNIEMERKKNDNR